MYLPYSYHIFLPDGTRNEIINILVLCLLRFIFSNLVSFRYNKIKLPAWCLRILEIVISKYLGCQIQDLGKPGLNIEKIHNLAILFCSPVKSFSSDSNWDATNNLLVWKKYDILCKYIVFIDCVPEKSPAIARKVNIL